MPLAHYSEVGPIFIFFLPSNTFLKTWIMLSQILQPCFQSIICLMTYSTTTFASIIAITSKGLKEKKTSSSFSN
jgi:hypothetical protein